MPTKKYNKKNRFQTKYSEPGTYVADAQYLSEQICERIAKKQETFLPYRFWQKPEWKKMFIQQTVQATRLLKEYSVFVILDVLKDYRARKVYSLGAKYVLEPLLKEYAKKRLQNTVEPATPVGQEENTLPEKLTRPVLAKRNVLGDIDG